jgi:hypothetical protein
VRPEILRVRSAIVRNWIHAISSAPRHNGIDNFLRGPEIACVSMGSPQMRMPMDAMQIGCDKNNPTPPTGLAIMP